MSTTEKPIQNVSLREFVDKFKAIKGVTFVAFPYKDKDGETSKRLINVGASYKNALVKDLETVKQMSGLEGIEEQARQEILKSLTLSLAKQYTLDGDVQSAETLIAECGFEITVKEKEDHQIKSEAQTNAYTSICNGIKYNFNEQALYIVGFSERKTIIEKSDKPDTRRPLTKAKDKIRHELRSGQYRSFKITNLIGTVSHNGDILDIVQ